MVVSAKLPRIERAEISKIKGRGANTFLIKGERLLCQIDDSGRHREFALVRQKPSGVAVFGRLNDAAIAFDEAGKHYVVKVGTTLYSVNLPEHVKACSERVVSRKFERARLSDQLITIGPDVVRIRRHGRLSHAL